MSYAFQSTPLTPHSVPNKSDEIDIPLDLVHITWLILAPIIFVVGLIGNTLILIVMTNHRMSGTSTSVHLTMMAAADIIVLVVGLVPDWLTECDIYHLVDVHPIICKIIKFLFYTAGDTSIWILVMFTIDRFIAICFPLRKVGCCTFERAKLFNLGALFLAICKNIVVFWSRGIELEPTPDPALTPISTTPRVRSRYNDKSDPFFGYLAALTAYSDLDSTTLNPPGTTCCDATTIPLTYDGYELQIINKFCGYRPEFEYWVKYVRPWIVFAVVYLIPFAVIVICNVFIVRALLKVKKEHVRRATPSTSGERSMFQMTMMCLSASIAFLVFIGPSIFVLIGKPYWHTEERAYKDAKAINNLCVYINHSINFFLYCITGHRFRRMICIVCRSRCQRAYDSSLDSLIDFRRLSVDRAKVAAARRARGRAYSDGLLVQPNGLFDMRRAASSAMLIDPLAAPRLEESTKSSVGRGGGIGQRGSNETVADDSPCGYRSSARRARQSVRDAVARGSFCRAAHESRRQGRKMKGGTYDIPPPYPPPPPPNEKPFPVEEIKRSPRIIFRENSRNVLHDNIANKSPAHLSAEYQSGDRILTPESPRSNGGASPKIGPNSTPVMQEFYRKLPDGYEGNKLNDGKSNNLYYRAGPVKVLPGVVCKETTC